MPDPTPGDDVAKEFTLYYSPFDKFEKCPQDFLWSRGWGSIDVGGGPGRGKPRPIKDSRHHAIMGITIQKVVEEMYARELWKHPASLAQTLVDMVEKEFNYEVARSFVDWRLAPPKAEMIQTCKDGVLGYLRTMKAHRLAGPYAKAEVDLLGYINKYNPVGGRADVIIRRDDTGTTILDGKNSQSKGKYTSPDQLRWYALCYYLAYGKLPDRLGFVYYRYPYGMPKEDGTTEEGVDWVPVTRPDIEGLAQRAVDARKAMDKEKFGATPSPKTCQFCDFQTVCPERISQKAANSKGRKKGDDFGDGFLDLTFGKGPA